MRKKSTVIKSVSFRANVEIKSFRHIHIEAAADVPNGRTPESVIDDLKTFVAKELQIAKDGEQQPVAVRQRRFGLV
jgi:hypothetical protein